MKLRKVIFLTIGAVLLLGWNAAAHEPPFRARPMGMLESELNLSDDQVRAVEEVFTDGHQRVFEILDEYGVKRRDARKMLGGLQSCLQQGSVKLANILNDEQHKLLQEELFHGAELGFMMLDTDERVAWLQGLLDLSPEDAVELEGIVARVKVQHDKVLARAGIQAEQFQAFQQDMLSQRREVKEGLSQILTKEQMADLEELRTQMKMRGQGPAPQRRGEH